MQKPKKKGVKLLTIFAYLVLLAYFVMLNVAGVVCQRADGGLLQQGAKSFVLNQVRLIPDTFSFGLPAGIIPSIIIYVYILIVIAAVVIAVKVGGKTNRNITANGMVAVMLSFVPLLITATGFNFYMDAFKQVAPYAGKRTFCSALILVGGAVLFAILAIALLFSCCKEALANPRPADGEEKAEEPAPIEEPIVEEKQKTEEELEEILESMTREDLLALIKQGVREVLAEQETDIKPEGNVIKDGKGTPILVQYFRGLGVEDITPLPAEEPAPAPVAAPEAPAEEAKVAAERVPFVERIANAEKPMKEAYNELKNELMSYGLKSRLSNSGDTFRLHRKTYVKMVMAGKGIKLYMALDPKAYADSPIPVQDVSEKNLYAEIPLAFKVKSDLSRRRAKQLIADCLKADGIEQGEVGNTNWVRQIRADLKAQKEAEK